MGSVSQLDGLKYGVRLAASILVIGAVAGGFFGMGLIVAGGTNSAVGTLGGAVLLLAATVVGLSGVFGLIYKVIADAVTAGNGAK